MTFALAVAAGLAIAGTGVFFVFAIGRLWIVYLMDADKWWSLPAWMASSFAILTPMMIGICLLAFHVAKLIAP
jgi:hypothetical protein